DYLNIWVCNLEGNALGFSSFPGSSGSQDGIVIDYQAFGRKGTVKPPYDIGRTATHEIGHWLSLIHIWGDAFCGNDLVDDTPKQEKPTFRCRTFPYTDACSPVSPGIMFMNYMDYTDDGCMQFFTDSQMIRMQSVLDNFRLSIRNSSGSVLPMPYVHDIEIDSVVAPVQSTLYRCLSPEIRLRNNGSDTVYAARIRYGFPGSVQQSEMWSGTLAPGEAVTVSLSPVGAADGIQVMEFRLAEQDDQSTNNYRSVAFTLGSLPNENCPENELLAYPNPVYSGGTVCVKTGLQRAQASQVQLIDVSGRVVWSKDQLVRPGDTLSVATGGLSKGVYLLVIAGEVNTEAIRFVVHEDENMPASTGNCE
ncbi:MAG: zinc-dependent metalloprotease, partial [Bacteroidota bacterium]